MRFMEQTGQAEQVIQKKGTKPWVRHEADGQGA